MNYEKNCDDVSDQGCVCEAAGWCERHQCQKTEHWYRLCQTRPAYFQLWEEGRGPGQAGSKDPSLMKKAVNYGKAVVRHVANRRRAVTDDVFDSRITVCESCTSLDRENRICREPGCGCYVDRKARWESEECPLGRWPELVTTQSTDLA